MIQRLLRGRLLYLVLGMVTLAVYAPQLLPLKPPGSHLPEGREPRITVVTDAKPEIPPRAASRHTLEWWPARLDPKALARLARSHPHLWLSSQLLVVFVLAMSLGGVGLFLWGLGSGRLPAVWRLRPRRLARWSLGELSRITLLTLAIASLLPFAHVGILSVLLGAPGLSALDDPNPWLTISMLILDAFVVLAIVTFAAGKPGRTRRSLGLSARRAGSAIAVGLRGYMALFPWLFLALFLVVVVAQRLGIEPPEEPIQRLILGEDRPWVLALTVLLACVVAPVAEECFFRAVAYPAVRQRTSPAVAMLVTGAAFSAIHTNLLGFLPIMMLGCLLAYLYERTGSLVSPLAIHVLHNSFLLTLALVVRRMVEASGR